MKSIFLLVLMTTIGLPYLYSQNDNITELRNVIDKKKTLHSLDTWQLDRIKGDNKAILVLNAVEYSELNAIDKTYAVQFDLYLESGSASYPASHFTKRLFRYIEENEYAEIIVAINEIYENHTLRKEKEQYGTIHYTTADGIKIGFEYTNLKDISFIEYTYNGIEFRAEFQYPDNFFKTIHEQLNIANKKLYLPENEEKLRKAKKSKQEANDVIIDDI